MKQFYTLIFILIISVNTLIANNNYDYLAVEKIKSGAFVLPTATITTSNSAVCINETQPIVTFTGSGGVAPYTFTYKINGGPDIITSQSIGNSVTLNVPTNVVGSFEYKLVSVKDSSGATQSQTSSTTITVASLPVVNFTFTNDNSCSGTAVQFNSNFTGSGTYTYAWDFGDGNTSVLQNPSYVFNNTNGNTTQSFNVTLKITNANGCVNSITKSISIKSPGATLNSNVDSDVFNGFPIFKVCTNDISQINFINTSITSSTDTNYDINWGDSTPNFTATTFSTTSHTYSVGLWTLTYTVTGQDGCVITRTYKVFVGNNPAVGIGNPGNTNICISSPLTFPITGTENNPPGTIYTVTFNDGSVPTTFNHPPPASITHTFLKSSCGVTSSGQQNSFSATIKASNPCDVSLGSVIPIRVSEPPVANFILPQDKVCINTQVCFTDSSTGGATATNSSCVNPKIVWLISPSTGYTLNSGTLGSDNNGSENTSTWTFGTNSICPVFSVPGTYTITMKTGNSCDIDEIVKTICVESKPDPQFTLNTNSGCGPLSVSTTNTTITTNSCNTTYLWNVTYTAANCGTTSSYNYTSGSSTSVSPVFNFVNPGIYSVTLTATNSCGSFTSAAQTVTVKQPPIVVVNAIATNCVNSPIIPSVFINSCSTTTNSALEYLWTFDGGTPSTSTSVTPPMVSYAIPGNYSIKLDVKNECGTTSATSNTFTINPRPIIQNETKSICNSSSFIITPSVLTTGNVIPSGTTYSWGAPVVTGGITGGQSGTNQTTINGTLTNPTNAVQTATYTVTPSSGGCTGMPFTIQTNVSAQIVIAASQTNVSCFGNSDGSAAVTATGGIAPYTYSWNTNPVQTTPTLTGLSVGNYTVTVTDAISCTKTHVINIGQPIVLGSSVITQTNVSCFGGSNGSATVLATGGTAPYLYSWNTNPVQTTATANGLLAGTYIVTITDGKGCSKTESVTITQPSAALNATSSQTDVSCFGSNSGSASVIASGGTAPYTYSWNTIPVQTTATAVGLIAGNYSVVVTDSKGCTKTEFFTISQPATGLTTAISSQTNLTCFGGNNGSATVTASGGVGVLTYSWNTNPVQTLATANGLIAGTYTVTVKDENGCTKTEQVLITQPDEIVISGVQTNVSCFGDSDGTATASATGGTGPYSYSWNTIPVQTTAKAVGLSVGTYTVTVTDASSCTKSQTISITQPIVLDASISLKTDVSCFGGSNGSATVLATGGTAPYFYSWNTSPIQTTASAIGLLAGTYIVTITDSKRCSKTQSVIINQPSAILNSSISAQTDVSCFGSNTGSATILATGGTFPYLYSWNTIPVQTSAIGSGLSAGTYTVTITDAKGCNKIQSVTISQPAIGITTAISSQTNLTCFGGNNGSATITASGGVGALTYSWNTNPVQTSATANGLIAGTYTVTVKDANGCSKTEQVNITQPNEIVISGAQTNVSCFGNSDGTATASVTGGTFPYSYSWNTIPVQTAAKATGLAVGTYTVTVTDVNGCIKTHPVTITQPLSELSSSISNSNNVSCSGGNNGNATVLATGGTAPYFYSWNTTPVQNLATATALKVGTYTVLVTDFNGCSTSSSITITEPVGITATTTQTNVLCAGDNTGSATVITTGGVGSYSYSWDTIPIQNSSTATNLKAGLYTVTISDENNCSITKQVTITEPNGIITSIGSQKNVDCFGNNTGAATILASGGNGTLSYSWNTNPINTTATAIGLSAGKYAVTVTDANNCSKIQIITITEPNDILITTDFKKDISCFGNANGSIAITITGGTPNYTFAWTKNGTPYQTTEDLSNLGPGVYKVTVSDANNCGPKTAIFTIVEPPILELNLVSQTNILCFGDASGAITTNVIGGNAPYTYAWTGPNGFTSSIPNLTAILAGTYNLKVTDNSGCSVNLFPVAITQPLEISITATTTPIICYGGNDASIDLIISGGISPYQTVWGTMATGTFQDNLSAGDYVITVTDASGCEKKITVNIPNPPVFSVNPIVKQISCFGAKDASINLNLVGGLSPVKLVWNDGSTSGLTRNNLGPGTYIATITDGKPCIITRTFIIQEPQPLVVGANITNALDCSNANSGAINLLVSGGTAPYSYVWNNGSVTEDLNNVPGGNYMVTVTDSRGCVQTKQYAITRPDPISIDVSTQLIFDCDLKTVSLKNIALASGGVPPFIYNWSSGTVSGIDKTVMETNQNGVVILMVTDALGCSANKTLNIDVPKIGSTSFASSSYANTTYGSYSIQDPIQFANTATGDYETIVWDFGDGSVSNEENPIHTFVKEGNYVVTQTVTYAFGCEYKYTITLNIDKGYKLIIPNGFTPNNDGINETFKPVFIGITSIQLEVYDTWGELLYSEIGETLRGWDGKIKGKESENGNYYYKVKASTFYGGIINENGPFTLIK